MNDQALLLSFADAAEILSVSRTMLYQMSSDGRLGPTPYKIGRRTLLRRAEIEAWVQAGLPPRTAWLEKRGANR